MTRNGTRWLAILTLGGLSAAVVLGTQIGTTTASQGPSSVVVVNGTNQPVPAILLDNPTAPASVAVKELDTELVRSLGGGEGFQRKAEAAGVGEVAFPFQTPTGNLQLQHLNMLITVPPGVNIATCALHAGTLDGMQFVAPRLVGAYGADNQFVVNEDVLLFGHAAWIQCATNPPSEIFVTATVSGRATPL